MACLGFQQITSLDNSVGLTIPSGARTALLQADTAGVRVRLDGQAAVAGSSGILLPASTWPQFHVTASDLPNVKVIKDANGAKLNVTYFD